MTKELFSEYRQITVVDNFADLSTRAFANDVNAICWFRELDVDFNEVVSKLQLQENVTEISVENLGSLKLSPRGIKARDIILTDLKLLTDLGALPVLNLIKCYERDNVFNFISTDVYSFHVDRSPVATDTYLCTYHGASGDILPNHQVQQKVLIPEIRKQLQELHEDLDYGFEEFLKDHFFDLHYQPKDNAVPINLGTGHLWKLAVDHPQQNTLPCVHRAPVEKEGEYRLLLIC